MQHQTKHFSLSQIVRLVASGRAALPEFQREFVWEPPQVIELLDSVANGWPIGSLLILEGPQPFGIKRIEGGPEVHADGVDFYLLDGQQRVTSLYQALTDSGEQIYYVDYAEAEPDGVPSIRWVDRKDGIPASRRETALTVAELADEKQFRDRLAMLPSATVRNLGEIRSHRIGHLISGEYNVPATVMARDIELEALTRIFETLNRTGVRLDAFDLMVAVLYPSGFHLRERHESAGLNFPILEFMDVPGLELLKLIALWRRDADRNDRRVPANRKVTGVRQRDILRIPGDFVERSWDRAITAYANALEHLRHHAGVLHKASVPSDAMTLTLAYLIDAGVPVRELEAWYWGSIADQRYLQGANTQIIADITAFSEGTSIVRGDTDEAIERLRASLLEPSRRNRILRLGMRGLLIRKGAVDPVTRGPLVGPVTSVSLQELAERRVRVGPQNSIAEEVVLTEESLRRLRRQVRRGDADQLLDDVGLATQAAPSITEIRVHADWKQRRVLAICSWMEELL